MRQASLAAWQRDVARILRGWRGGVGRARARNASRQAPGNRRVFVIPPAAPGSVGDQAFVEATVGLARERGWQPVLLLGEESAPWDGRLRGIAQQRLPLHQSWRAVPALESFVDAMRPSDAVVALGADVACGAYGRDALVPLLYVGEAARRGHRAGVVSLGFDTQPDAPFLRVFRELPPSAAIVTRDPVAYRRARRLLARPVGLAGDIAFAWAGPFDEPAPADLAGWLARERGQGRLLVLVNVHSLLIGVSPLAVDEASAAMVDALVDDVAGVLTATVNGERASVVLLPHDRRGRLSDERVLAEVCRRVAPDAAAHVRDAGRCTVTTSRWLAGQVDLAVSGRMHLAISCLVAGTPVICVSYQDKFTGLLADFGLDQLILTPSELRTPAPVRRVLAQARAQAASLRRQIGGRIAGLRDLARTNLDFLVAETPMPTEPQR